MINNNDKFMTHVLWEIPRGCRRREFEVGCIFMVTLINILNNLLTKAIVEADLEKMYDLPSLKSN